MKRILRRGVVCSVITAVLVAVGASAGAAAPWSEPRAVADVIGGDIVFLPSGRGVVTWTDEYTSDTWARVVNRTGALGRPYVLARRFRTQEVVAAGRDRVLLLGRPFGFGDRYGVATARLGHARGRATPIGPRGWGAGRTLVASGHGHVALAFRSPRAPYPVRVAVRDPRGRWRTQLAAGRARGDYSGESVAINKRGELVVAWQDGRSLFARRIDAHGRRGRPQRLGDLGPYATTNCCLGVGVGLTSNGVAVVAWERPNESDFAFGADAQLVAAVAPPRRRFRKPRVLDPHTYSPRPRVVPTGAGRLAVFWSDRRLVDFTARGPGAPQDIAPDAPAPDTYQRVMDIAAGPRGELLAMLETQVSGGSGPARVAVRRRRGEAFVIEDLAPATPGYNRGATGAAFQPTTGRPFAMWSEFVTPCEGPCRYSMFLTSRAALR